MAAVAMARRVAKTSAANVLIIQDKGVRLSSTRNDLNYLCHLSYEIDMQTDYYV